ncbi:MAG TPA: ABC transporter ATP-binding protein [Caulobacteraceae bacterium]
MSPALELAGASARLGGRMVLENASLAVRPGEVLGVIGPNGSGKTTLLRAGLGLVRLCEGEARLGGRPVATLSEVERASLAAYMPQGRRAAWNMPAWRIAALGAPLAAPAAARQAALEALDSLGISALADRGVRDMSGGEQAKVLAARLLATRAPLLIADEPTAGLDPAAALGIMAVLVKRAKAGAAVLVTQHDLTVAARCCDRLVVMSLGHLMAIGAVSECLTPAILAEVFGLHGQLLETPSGTVLAADRLSGG